MTNDEADAIAAAGHRARLTKQPRTRQVRRNPFVKLALCIMGCVLLVGAALVGPIPGPGGLILAAAGLGLLLKNSRRAKRGYVRFERRFPKAGGWSDWALRRPSARRREALRKRAGVGAESPVD